MIESKILASKLLVQSDVKSFFELALALDKNDLEKSTSLFTILSICYTSCFLTN